MRLLPLLLAVTALHADYADDLCEMARQDQKERFELIQSEQLQRGPDEKRQAAIREADLDRTARLKEIIAEHGWPTITKVGPRAANAAWLIAQHSTHDPEFMAEVLTLITPLVATGDCDPHWFALLADRVRVLCCEPQLYGTQYKSDWVDGTLSLVPSTPIAEPHLLDERRAALGLEPHFEYVSQLIANIDVPQ